MFALLSSGSVVDRNFLNHLNLDPSVLTLSAHYDSIFLTKRPMANRY